METRYIDTNVRLGTFGTTKVHDFVSMKSLCYDTRENDKRKFVPVDSDKAAQIQVGDNYGNCFFMNREGGNKLFIALKKGIIDRSLFGWDLHKAIRSFLVENDITFTVGCSQP